MFTIGMGLMGTFYAGIKANSLDIAPNYAGISEHYAFVEQWKIDITNF